MTVEIIECKVLCHDWIAMMHVLILIWHKPILAQTKHLPWVLRSCLNHFSLFLPPNLPQLDSAVHPWSVNCKVDAWIASLMLHATTNQHFTNMHVFVPRSSTKACDMQPKTCLQWLIQGAVVVFCFLVLGYTPRYRQSSRQSFGKQLLHAGMWNNRRSPKSCDLGQLSQPPSYQEWKGAGFPFTALAG